MTFLDENNDYLGEERYTGGNNSECNFPGILDIPALEIISVPLGTKPAPTGAQKGAPVDWSGRGTFLCPDRGIFLCPVRGTFL